MVTKNKKVRSLGVTIKAPSVHQITIVQLMVLLVLALLTVLVVGKTESYSLLLGGICQIIPQAWFARMAYRYRGASQAAKILTAMYKGETGKLLMTATMFGLMFFYIQPLHVPTVFLAYIVMAVIYGYGAAKMLGQKRNEQKPDAGN